MTLDDLLTKWLGREGGAERANYQMFLSEFTRALGLPEPEPKGMGLGDYEFEAPVRSEAIYGGKGTKRIDLYKRDCFILEAKQSQLKPGETADPEPAAPPPEIVYDLLGHAIGTTPPKGKPAPRYDRLMADARLQAERYALALPAEHRSPPFLIVADIGRAFEVYFDWAGNGRGYAPFPDERRYRIALTDLADPEVQARLRGIWTDPASVDPRLKAAAVTRDIAGLLSQVAARLEQEERQRNPGAVEVALGIEQTSLFLMRVLFCMFAEDVELLPKDSFKRFLATTIDRSDQYWRSGLTELWRGMNDPVEANRYWSHGDAIVRYFNGNLFATTRLYDLPSQDREKLLEAAGKDWRAVEPAIFGTLLEQVLTTADRAKLGAHYTPRAYVERLVEATMMEVLRPEWEAVLAAARDALDPPRDGEVGRAERVTEGGQSRAVNPDRGPLHHSALPSGPPPRPGEDLKRAIALVVAFHARLTDVRVLDPACGTGNFLYVAMEQLLRLEGEVRQFAASLGVEIAPAVHPNQFLGLELNPRAAVIAELVLWIGWLRYRLANTPDAIGGKDGGEPVLPTLTNINRGTHGGYDAVLVRDETGEPDTANPRRPVWPDADFIIGNPPFIGGKDVRERLGGEYAEALWRANPRVPKSADFVMQWWDRAADVLTRPDTRLRRFGFVTTNSITQVFSRRVIEGWLAENPSPLVGEGGAAPAAGGEGDFGSADGIPPHPSAPAALQHRVNSAPRYSGHAGGMTDPLLSPTRGEGNDDKLHLTLAIPDHPWTRVGKDAAAVRIAMTVAERGPGTGRLVTITGERGLDTDAPALDEAVGYGTVNADLSVGTDVTRVVPLKANEGLCSPGVKLHGAGFIVTPAEAKALGLGTRPGLEAHIREYRNGRDLLQRPRGVMVIDLFGLSENEITDRFPEVADRLLTTVRVDREKQVAKSPTIDAKAYLQKWWVFGKPRTELRPALAGLNRYIATTETSKHRLFQFLDASVLPDNSAVVVASDSATDLGFLSSRFHTEWVLERGGWLGFGNDNRYSKSLVFDPFPFPAATEAQAAVIGAIAERLDQTRRAALAEDDRLTMTGLYNLVAAIRDGTLASADEAKAVRARARIVAKLHDDLDAAVAAAYGWEWPLPPAEIIRRLVALNAERAAEEAAGQVRWLRPEYQQPRFG